MPSGLDGNPDPIVTDARSAVLDRVAAEILRRRPESGPMLVAIDGIDGAGKSTFADELTLQLSAKAVVRSTIDSFHHPRSHRWQKGERSALGFYADSHDLETVRHDLLEPLGGGKGRYRVEAFHEPSDQPLSALWHEVAGDELLVFDGIFLCRPELLDLWDLVIFLDGRDRVNLERLGLVLDDVNSLDGSAPAEEIVGRVLTWVERIDRYASGMSIYLDEVDPASKADVVIDNNDLANPRILSSPVIATRSERAGHRPTS